MRLLLVSSRAKRVKIFPPWPLDVLKRRELRLCLCFTNESLRFLEDPTTAFVSIASAHLAAALIGGTVSHSLQPALYVLELIEL